MFQDARLALTERDPSLSQQADKELELWTFLDVHFQQRVVCSFVGAMIKVWLIILLFNFLCPFSYGRDLEYMGHFHCSLFACRIRNSLDEFEELTIKKFLVLLSCHLKEILEFLVEPLYHGAGGNKSSEIVLRVADEAVEL